MNAGRIGDLLFNPDSFFSGLDQKKPDLLVPFCIILVGGLANLATSLVYETNVYWYILRTLLFTTVPEMMLILPFLIWVLVGTVLFVVGSWISKTGSFRVTLANTGYAMVPLIILGGIIDISIFTVLPATRFDFQAGASVALILFLIVIVSFFWTGYLLVFGVRNAHSLSQSQAFNVVIIALILVILIVSTLDLAIVGIGAGAPPG
ncbi:hypothetical protein J2741_001448 [Methanolinea mesophila]|uniref:Yip1 family protein n=1 Tax=Methanolinea mesophila TaxID=547055 RepID=UPI001AE96F48|nr:Yip1 family protein [Methanolinea mesophila]MBP1928901.1 hypothetical protein [Methanolinea mesophila]